MSESSSCSLELDSDSSSSSSSPLCSPATTTTTIIVDKPLRTMDVCITNVHGRDVIITVDNSWTVERLKKDYALRYATTWNCWYMMYLGKYLRNGDRLFDYNINDGSTIYVTCRQAHQLKQPIELYITDMNDIDNNIVLVYADLEWTIQRVKKEYAQQKGSEHQTCRLYSKGCSLQEKLTLADYKLSDVAVIHSVLSSTPATQVGLRSLKKCILRKRSCKFL